MTDNLSKALKLASLGFSVFPASANTKVGVTPHGHLDSTTDPEQIATWWSGEYPNAVVGVHAGASEVIFLDVDVNESKDGFDTLGFLDIPDTFQYTTRSGKGKHFVYDLADSASIPPSNKYRGMAGVDRKSGSSFCIWWGDEVPASRDELSMPPGWLLDLPERTTNFKDGFGGSISEWLETLDDGEPTKTVRELVENAPTDQFGHAEVISITYRLVRLGAEGHSGVPWAFEELWAKWVRPPWDSPELQRELLDAIGGAVRKAGAEDADISSLPSYMDSLELVTNELMEILTGKPGEKRTYFTAIGVAVALSIPDDEIASLVWNAPATKLIARDWGITFLREQIAKAHLEDAYESGENVSPPEPEEERQELDIEVSLLSAEERNSLEGRMTWVDRYVAYAGTKTAKQNVPYDRINGWTILSNVMSDSGFIPRKNGKEPLNLFTMTLGDTTTGKSQARKLMMGTLRECFIGDPGFNIGGNGSPNALSEALIKRDGLVSFFNKDEAHGALKVWTDPKNWAAGLLEDLALYYDGHVPPHLFKGSKETSGKSATTFFCMHLMGTPRAMMDVMNRELFNTGFLARFQWAIGDAREVTFEGMAEEDSDGEDIVHGFDPYQRQIAAELLLAKRMVRSYTDTAQVPIKITREAAVRLQQAKWELSKLFEKSDNFDILEPSMVRMGVTIRKCASLLAMSDGRQVASLQDVLHSIEAAEEWVANAATVASQISSSDFERSTNEVEEFVVAKGGSVKREVVMRRFKALETKYLVGYIEALIAQGRLTAIKGQGDNIYLESYKK